jgi:hypothetical protein
MQYLELLQRREETIVLQQMHKHYFLKMLEMLGLIEDARN